MTIEDVIEEFVGPIRDEDDLDEIASSTLGPSDEISGLLGRAELTRMAGVELPDGNFDTLGGFVIEQLGRLAEVGGAVEWHEWVFTVTELDGRRVDRVRVTRVGGPEDGEPKDGEPKDGEPKDGGLTGRSAS